MIKFFLVPYESPVNAKYQHGCICLGEGLKALGIPFICNIDYWYENESKNFLFKSSDENGDIHIYSTSFLLENQFKTFSARTRIVVDLEDGRYGKIQQIDPCQYEFYLRAHFNGHYDYGSKVYPWAFGLSNRIANALISDKSDIQIDNSILVTFRVGHTVRDFLTRLLSDANGFELKYFQDKHEEKEFPDYWAQSGRRHSKGYYEAISMHGLLAAYGGYYEVKPSLPAIAKSIAYRLVDKYSFCRLNPFSHTIYQFDSCRFWEGMISDSIPVHINFDRWGIRWPVPIKPYVHYLPLDLNGNEVNRWRKTDFAELSRRSSNFAMKHYSPIPVSERLLNLIEYDC